MIHRRGRTGFEEMEWGILKRRVLEGGSEENDDWKVGHPIVFPHILSVGAGDERVDSRYYAFQIRVPMDDTHTMHLWYTAYVPPNYFTESGVDAESSVLKVLRSDAGGDPFGLLVPPPRDEPQERMTLPGRQGCARFCVAQDADLSSART